MQAMRAFTDNRMLTRQTSCCVSILLCSPSVKPAKKSTFLMPMTFLSSVQIVVATIMGQDSLWHIARFTTQKYACADGDHARKCDHPNLLILACQQKVTVQHRVYSDGKKIASIGLRIRHGCSYHGIAINVTNDLTPFSYINPCGMIGQPMMALVKQAPDVTITSVAIHLNSI